MQRCTADWVRSPSGRLDCCDSFHRYCDEGCIGNRENRHRAFVTSGTQASEATMNTLDSFSDTYQQARDKFLDAASGAAGEPEKFWHPEVGPDGSQLSTDVAWLGPRDAERVLVLISATHGVEGFAGSGAQVDWLARGEAARLPPGVAALLIHAINPYGFAWLGRGTHENVDLNRNWVDFNEPLPENTAYDALADAIWP